ncbi:MAG: hypothetical protein ABGY42_10165 [bacterium]
MPSLRQLLAAKAVLSFFTLCLPLLFLPLSGFQLLGFPVYDQPAAFFIRLLGATYFSLVVVEGWSAFDPPRRKGGLIAALAECIATTLVLWHFVFYGYLGTWRILGKLIVLGAGVLTLVFFVLLLATGYRALFEPIDAPEENG